MGGFTGQGAALGKDGEQSGKNQLTLLQTGGADGLHSPIESAFRTGWSADCSLQGGTPSRELRIEFRRAIVESSAAAGADT
jgi:hypothetical protein